MSARHHHGRGGDDDDEAAAAVDDAAASSSATPPARAASLIQLRYRQDVTFRPREVKLLRTGLSLLNLPAEHLVCVTANVSDDERGRGDDDDDDGAGAAGPPIQPKFTVLDGETNYEQLIVEVRNRDDVPHRLRDRPLELNVFCLPLPPVSVNPLHLFSPAVARAATAARPASLESDASPRARITAVTRKAGSVWVLRLAMSELQWTAKRDANLHPTLHYVTKVTVQTRPARLHAVDGLVLQMCSDPQVQLLKAQTLQPDQYSGPIELHLRRLDNNPPPPDLFMQVALYAHRGPVVLRHHPGPFLAPHPHNGFVVQSPRSLRLRPGQRATVVIPNGFSANQQYRAIFFPTDLAGLNVQAGPWPEKCNLQIELEAYNQPVHLDRLQRLGTVHFFPEDVFVPTRAPERLLPSLQYQTATRLLCDDGEASADEDDDDEDPFATGTEGPDDVFRDDEDDAGSAASDAADGGEPAPTTGRRGGTSTSPLDEDEDEEEEDDEETDSDTELPTTPHIFTHTLFGDRLPPQLHWRQWNLSLSLDSVLALRYHLDLRHLENPAAARWSEETSWSEVARLSELLGDWVAVPSVAPRPAGAGEVGPSRPRSHSTGGGRRGGDPASPSGGASSPPSASSSRRQHQLRLARF
ncbi:T82 [Tupaiid betaherpesvirus 1]|uniref:T82 n=1 Tax=Tupaiid herpesvirus 1 (strain 1) TaxID=10397 RepID=Q91TL4_TUHV1|nr:T82 [Tupaiid betaherpesvirus 1]AAK57127.1 T82 [Tupaiid betaherpesvirus 1]